MESKQILISRKSVLKEWRNKEWWYTGLFDAESGIYFSFFFVRVNVTDQINFTLFDPKLPDPLHFSKNIILNPSSDADVLDLSYSASGLPFYYRGSGEIGWKFNFKNKDYDIQLTSKPTIPPFTKFDMMGSNQFALLHYFQNIVNGYVRTADKLYPIKDAKSYYDHCYGKLPRKTGWHWLAVQNDNFSLASLVNYGTDPQRYTQLFCSEKTESPIQNEWIRLNQDVSFEYDFNRPHFEQTWKVTSTDLDLEVYPVQHISIKTAIPPVVPFLVSLNHTECFVRVTGRIKVDHQWIQTGELFGVLEEHFGKW